MKIVTFTDGQGSDSWLKWRRQGIGASDISIIAGSNPYKTPLKLWDIKCGFKEEDQYLNPAMKHGINHEDIARQWINSQYKLNLKPLCVEDPDKPHFRASLDGYDFATETLCEIKCPISEKVLDRALKDQAVPDYWFDQMQWQIMICNPKMAFFALWDYRTQSCIKIDMFGHENRINIMREKGDKFWQNVQVGKAPAPEKGDYIEIEGEGLHEILLEYQELTENKKALDVRLKEIKTKIESYGDDGNFIAYGFKVQRVMPSPRYDIEHMKRDGLELDKYIKKISSIGWYRIFPPKKT